jgi:hypothetical protein
MQLETKLITYNDSIAICKDTLGSNPKIRSVTLCNPYGSIVYSLHRQDRDSLASHNEGNAFLTQAAVRFYNRKLLEDNFGKIQYTLTIHERVIRISFPLLDCVLLISADRDGNFESLTSSISQIIEKWTTKLAKT